MDEVAFIFTAETEELPEKEKKSLLNKLNEAEHDKYYMAILKSPGIKRLFQIINPVFQG